MAEKTKLITQLRDAKNLIEQLEQDKVKLPNLWYWDLLRAPKFALKAARSIYMYVCFSKFL